MCSWLQIGAAIAGILREMRAQQRLTLRAAARHATASSRHAAWEGEGPPWLAYRVLDEQRQQQHAVDVTEVQLLAAHRDSLACSGGESAGAWTTQQDVELWFRAISSRAGSGTAAWREAGRTEPGAERQEAEA